LDNLSFNCVPAPNGECPKGGGWEKVLSADVEDTSYEDLNEDGWACKKTIYKDNQHWKQ
jgi:hypothetical protein